ncbi:MAG: hypothetical protein M3Q65_26370, partial [Chloroflexota bacterium]|nr:hypothetical protein [Chloroflexota bacterium]
GWAWNRPRIAPRGEGATVRRTSKAAKREVRAVFESDRLARESLERAYARLAPVPLKRAKPAALPAQRGGTAAATQGGQP